MNITITALHTNSRPAFTARKTAPVTREQILNLRDSGLPETKIAKQLGVSTAYYYKKLKEFGLAKKLAKYNDELNKISKEKFETLLKHNFSINDICSYFKITTTAYYNLLERFNLKSYMHGANSKVVTKELLQELVDNNLPTEEICKRLNISKFVYYKLIVKLDIQTPAKIARERVSKITKEEIEKLIESGKT